MRDILDKAAARCDEYRQKGYHCSEASMRAVSETLNLQLSEDMLKACCGFMSGGGGMKERCGIVETGIMLISCLHGRLSPDEKTWKYNHLIRLLHKRFTESLGSYNCRELLSLAKQNHDDSNCAITYSEGTRILTGLLLEADSIIMEMQERKKGQG